MDSRSSPFETVRDAALGLDVPALELARARAVGHVPPGWSEWARLFADLLGGDHAGARARAETLEREAGLARDAALVIEAAALRALALAALGDLDEARKVARRASRMARTEALPEQEQIAHIVLARVRRLTGHPHLAARILTSLARVASPRFLPWIAWELAMAGAENAVEIPLAACPRSPARDAALALLSFFDAAERGASEEIAGRARALGASARFPIHAADVDALTSTTDIARAPRDEAVASWCLGRTAESPPALHGVLTRGGSAPKDEAAIAYVASHAPTGPRRIPRIAWALANVEGVLALPQGRKKQGRNESVVAALALAGRDGLSEPELFADVYGFEYVPEMHRSVFGVALHRAREYLGDAGAIESGRGRVTLTLFRPILVPDPRCTKPMQDRLLRAIAEHRRATAREVAQAIGVSLRVAQEKLAELSADGACVAHREGREVRYEVEDTTFSDPTAHR